MTKNLTWKVGGAQGEGIDSTGEIFTLAMHRMGYYTFTYRHFMSLIKGGHTNYKARVSNSIVRHHGDDLDILIAFDQQTINYNYHEMTDGSVLIYDSSFTAEIPTGRQVNVCPIPLLNIAKEQGSAIMKNMVAAGASAAILGLESEEFRSVVADRFAGKGDEIIEQNMGAIRAGYDYYRSQFNTFMDLPPVTEKKERMFISGNEATAMGALAAGCRVLAQYPITPATEVMYWLVKHFPEFGGIVVQAEDEISAVNMAIGANFAGVRSMTATSGPGFSLMMEALGLAGMSETPLVIIDVQRGGPSTGLPTKTEQSDLNEALYGSHGEIPRIVLTPRTVEECFYLTMEAFNLAEKFQCPVIVASDLYLGMSKMTIDDLDFDKIQIDRGNLITDEELLQLEPGSFKRFDVSAEGGISKRSMPSQKNGRFVAMGNEHDEVGVEIEDQWLRIAQMDKRARKLEAFSSENGVIFEGNSTPDLLLIGFGSSIGPINEVYKKMLEDGQSVAHLQIGQMAPFPKEVETHVKNAKKLLVVEINSTGQLANQLRMHIGGHEKVHSHLKYDGDPLTSIEIYKKAQEVMN